MLEGKDSSQVHNHKDLYWEDWTAARFKIGQPWKSQVQMTMVVPQSVTTRKINAGKNGP
jgi:hypothetical protein